MPNIPVLDCSTDNFYRALVLLLDPSHASPALFPLSRSTHTTNETHKENPLETLERIEALMLDAAAGLGDAVYRVHYDDYVAQPEVLRGLFEWLGEPWDPEAVAQVLGTRHSRPGRHRRVEGPA